MNFYFSRDYSISLLDEFLKHKIDRYDAERNFDYGLKDRRVVSTLSPYISHGVLKEKEVLKKVLANSKISNKFVQEVFWRIYWKGWLENKNLVWSNFLNYINNFNKFEEIDFDVYKNALKSKTDIAPFDYWATTLMEKGYLHNHTRMWFASIWVHYLGLPWQLGAKFFYENLLDADPASNTLSWRWVAGLQTKGKKYIASEKNINAFTQNKFKGFKLPELKNITLQNDNIIENQLTYSRYPEIKKDKALIVFENNIYPKLLEKAKEYKIIILISCRAQSLQLSRLVKNFKEGLRNDFIDNMKKKSLKVHEISLPKEEDKLFSLLENNNVEKVVYDYITVGVEKDIFANFCKRKYNFISTENVLDDFYQESWKFTKKGFFKFKEKIPYLLDRFF